MAVTKPIRGIIGACLTPFTDDDRVDYQALEKEIEFLVTDCDAITVAAVEAAEYTMLTRDERKEVLKVATEMIGKRVPVILGCSSPAPREVIELAEQFVLPFRWSRHETHRRCIRRIRQEARLARVSRRYLGR